MAGVKIGLVEKVELENSRAKVTMRIDPEVKIQRGTEAMIKTMGLLGEKYVEFVPVKRDEHQQPCGRRRLHVSRRRAGTGNDIAERRGQAHQPAFVDLR